MKRECYRRSISSSGGTTRRETDDCRNLRIRLGGGPSVRSLHTKSSIEDVGVLTQPIGLSSGFRGAFRFELAAALIRSGENERELWAFGTERRTDYAKAD